MIGRRLLLWLFGAATVAPAAPRVAVAAPISSFPFLLLHPKCGMPAFFVRRDIQPGDRMLSCDIARLDGSPMPAYSLVACGSCGEHFEPKTAYIRKRWAVGA